MTSIKSYNDTKDVIFGLDPNIYVYKIINVKDCRVKPDNDKIKSHNSIIKYYKIINLFGKLEITSILVYNSYYPKSIIIGVL